MKRIVLGLLALITLGVGWEIVYPTASKADVAKAGQKVQEDERQLATAASESRRIAGAISEAASKPDSSEGREALAQETAAVDRNKQNVDKLTARLEKDLSAFDMATGQRWSDYREHTDAMKGDAWTKRTWMRRGERWHEAAARVLNDGRVVIREAHGVLAQAEDLEHAAACLRIEREMQSATVDLRTSILQLRASAGEFARGAGELLARITEGTVSSAD